MKKEILRSFRNTILLLGGGLVAALMFTSCENFLNGAGIKNQIEEQIAYANATECVFVVKSDETQGSFLSSGDKSCKVGYTTDLQFTVNKSNCVFQGLEAVSSLNPIESRADCVSFTVSEANENTGTYKITVKIIKYAADILIRPVCVPYPAVASYSPSDDDTQFANMPITIKFNMAMESSETTGETSLFNYDNISLLSNGISVSAYFENPSFNPDKTILTLTPKSESLKNFIVNQHTSFIEVKVSLSDKIIVTQGDLSIALKQDTNASFTVKYKGEIDTTPPQRLEFFATRHEITLATANSLADENKFLEEIFSTSGGANFEKCQKNKCNGTLYIYGKFYDKVPGVKSVTIGDVVYDSSNAEFESDESGNTMFCIKHTLPEDEDNDLNCVVSDGLGNNSTAVAFTAYKKTLVLNSILFYNFDHSFFYNVDEDGYPDTTLKDFFDLDYYNANRRIVKINYDWDKYECNPFIQDDVFYQRFDYSNYIDETEYYSSFVFECEYKDKNGVVRHGTFQNNGAEKYLYYELENVDKLNGLKINLFVTDDVQNRAEKEIVFPVPSFVTSITKQSNGTAKIKFQGVDIGQAISDAEDEGAVMAPSQFLIYEESGQIKSLSAPDPTISSPETIREGLSYRAVPSHAQNWYSWFFYLLGDIGSVEYTTESTLGAAPDVVIDGEPLLQQGGQSGSDYYINITVKIAEDSWDIFDDIYLNKESSSGNPYYYGKYFFNRGECSLTIPMGISGMYKEDTEFTLFGIKNNFRSQGTVCTIPKLTGSAYDYMPPKITFTKNGSGREIYYNIKLTDSESGPDYANVQNFEENGNYKYVLNESNNWTVDIPIWEFSELINAQWKDDDRYAGYSQRVYCLVEGFDKNENEAYERQLVSLDWAYHFSRPVQNANHSAEYDLMTPNGKSKTSVGISSNESVLVHTLVTTKPYSECKDWTLGQWEHYRKTLNEKTLSFTSSDHSAKRYDVPIDQINPGECYCVVAWFADGTSAQSDVWQK